MGQRSSATVAALLPPGPGKLRRQHDQRGHITRPRIGCEAVDLGGECRALLARIPRHPVPVATLLSRHEPAGDCRGFGVVIPCILQGAGDLTGLAAGGADVGREA